MSIVDKSFNARKSLCAQRADYLFTVFDQKLNTDQEEALKFLYAFMPLSDLADYSGEFFLANVKTSLLARAETPWGIDIPEDIFLHYVLPVRVNNENLDSFRIDYYDEIMNRIKGMDLKEAALEINHWCHEKVAYQAADERTSSPIYTILSARGRCGEESTFTVAALRTAGIPARQVYTPRWAHCDDNHAWVEIWDNGKWYYTGACEPEPVLDLGWFTEPARRAMMIHTKSFGAPLGNENVIIKKKYYTDVSDLSKYALTKTIYVKVLDNNGKVVPGANVEYQLYNYAEFYPLADIPTDSNGISHLETGHGDLLIWAYKNNDFDYRKISVIETDTLILTLNRKATDSYSVDLDIDVPIVRAPLPIPSPDLIRANTQRTNNENIIRQNYIDSWMKPGEAKELAARLDMDPDKVSIAIERSMGNYREISSFLSGVPDSLRDLGLELLEILPDKDLRDVKATTLSDHLLNCVNPLAHKGEDKFFIEYVLNPRVDNEIIAPWRGYFKSNLPEELLQNGASNPSTVIEYIDKTINIDNEGNYYGTPITPRGVNELKISDPKSRDICFVAICRSLGIPSRLEPGIKIPQYFKNGEWNDVFFSGQHPESDNKGFIMFKSSDTKPVPEYYIHFTLARFENGRYNTLEYDYNRKVTDFRDELPLPPGNYMLVTGNRLSNGGILSNLSFFNLSEGEHKTLDIELRKDSTEKRTLGTISLTNLLSLFEGSADVNKKGTVVVWLDPESEPAKHIMNDMSLLSKELDKWGGDLLFLTDASNSAGHDSPALALPGLPAKARFSTDNHMEAFNKYVKMDSQEPLQKPVVVLADAKGNIIYISSGYRIGIGENILKHAN